MRDLAGETSRRPSRARLARITTLLTMLGAVLFATVPAHAVPVIDGPPASPVSSPFTELEIADISADQGLENVAAYEAPSTFDPVASGYPTSIPAGSTPNNVGYAGVIPARDNTGAEVLTYCIDLFTSTQTGVTYERGDWTEANVRNLGYVGYILQNYYPSVPTAPAGVADNVKAAAVQAAIWFFSDNLVLDPNSRPQLFQLTSAIVADAIANGPAAEPVQPELSISPEEAVAPETGELVGPFTVTSNGPGTLRVLGVEVFADAAGTQALADGATIQPGAQLWARSTSTSANQGFSVERAEEIRESTVYLYDGQVPGRDDAQKLILARDETIEAVASVRITRVAAGAIEVTKVITGDGAGLQGAVEISVECTPPGEGDPVTRTVTVPAGTTASQTTTLTGLPAGYSCAITETDDGDNGQVSVAATTIDPGTVTIVDGQTSAVTVTNTYDVATGGIAVTKAITGDGAGLQGDVVIGISCTQAGEAPVTRSVTIPAGTTGSQTTTVDGIPVGYSCAIAETDNGDNGRVSVTATSITPGTVTVTEGTNVPVAVTNEYDVAVGGLEVTKTITGDGAGLQDAVAISVECQSPDGGDPVSRTVTIPAGTTGSQTTRVDEIPAGYTCAITETENGDNDLVTVAATSITPETVTVVEDETTSVSVTNRYDNALGALEVTKTISGQAAGLQDAIVVRTVCTPPGGGTPLERTLTIAAGTAAGPQSATYADIPAGSVCEVTEVSNGDNGRVAVTATTIDPGSVTIAEGQTQAVAVTNDYARAVGALEVTKVIGGPAAGRQDDVVIAVDCDVDSFDQEFTIPAGSTAGGYVNTVEDIPTGTTCAITETASGATETIVLLAPTTITTSPVTIAEDETSAVRIVNNYREEEVVIDDDDVIIDDDYGYGDEILAATGALPGPPWGLGVLLAGVGTALLIVRRRLRS